MSLLSKVTSGVSQSGIRVVIAGQEKMGKTTLCASMPNTLLVPLEVGYEGITTPKTPMIQTYAEFMGLLNELLNQYRAYGQTQYKTLIIDSATALERHIHNQVVIGDPAYKSKGATKITMETCYGGYGRGHTMATEYFNELLKFFDILAIHAGMNIVLTCHVFSSKVVDPTSGEYDSWDLLLHSPKNMKTYGKREALMQWADLVGFMYEPIYVSESGGVSKGVSQNRGRVMGLSRTPSYAAGNRFGLEGEVSIPGPPANGWNQIAKLIYEKTGRDLFTR